MTDPDFPSPLLRANLAEPTLAQATLAAVTPQVYTSFKRAVATRKWPDGRLLSAEQLQTCLQAIITYEHHHLPPEQRTGYIPPKQPCADDTHIHTREAVVQGSGANIRNDATTINNDEKPIKWQE